MSDSYDVVYSPRAVEDLKEIYEYIAYELQEQGVALAQINRIRKEVRSLDIFPFRYCIVDWEPWKSMEMHKVPVDNFVIFYRVDIDISSVIIVRILYGRRDMETIAQENPE